MFENDGNIYLKEFITLQTMHFLLTNRYMFLSPIGRMTKSQVNS